MNRDLVIEATKRCIRKANRMFNVKIPVDTVLFSFYTTEPTAMAVYYPTRPLHSRFAFHFNNFVVKTNVAIILRSVVPHEVAHHVMHYKQHVQGLHEDAPDHGNEWKAICLALGGTGSLYTACYSSYPTLTRDTEYFEVITDTKYVVHISKARYNKLLDGFRYRLKQTYEVIGFEHLTHASVWRSELIARNELNDVRYVLRY